MSVLCSGKARFGPPQLKPYSRTWSRRKGYRKIGDILRQGRSLGDKILALADAKAQIESIPADSNESMATSSVGLDGLRIPGPKELCHVSEDEMSLENHHSPGAGKLYNDHKIWQPLRRRIELTSHLLIQMSPWLQHQTFRTHLSRPAGQAAISATLTCNSGSPIISNVMPADIAPSMETKQSSGLNHARTAVVVKNTKADNETDTSDNDDYMQSVMLNKAKKLEYLRVTRSKLGISKQLAHETPSQKELLLNIRCFGSGFIQKSEDKHLQHRPPSTTLKAFIDRIKKQSSHDTTVLQKDNLSQQATSRTSKERITSLSFHPDVVKSRPFTGLWNFEDPSNKTNLEVMFPHKRSINCVSINSWKHEVKDKGTVPRKAVWHKEIDATTIAVAYDDGVVAVVDKNDTLVLASLKGLTSWDRRFLAKPLWSCKMAKGANSSFFSMSGSYMLTTCCSNEIRIFNTSFPAYTESVVIPHKTTTLARLPLTRAMWHPNSDSFFAVRNVPATASDRRVASVPAKVLIFTHAEEPVKELLTPIPTLIPQQLAWHPHADLGVIGYGSCNGHAILFYSTLSVNHV
ncbi:WD40/YVTN repeat-like-containing domain superfamily [Sesbania bispinosa]|nr:WD40/YVTN repeat-like-containing domain superfamily [Sesbania bispinosa]